MLDKIIININCTTSFVYIHIDLLLVDDHICGADGEGHHQQAQDQGERGERILHPPLDIIHLSIVFQ
jgi:hypothetical protein